MEEMKITIATVCFNEEDTIEMTMKSVLSQTYKNIEYLIIDGKSSDSTIDKVKKYISDSRICLVSEEDRGLYHAMNKAAKMCTGEYIIYMNSGDLFHDKKVIEDMQPYLNKDLVYGNVIRNINSGKKTEKYHGRYKIMGLLLIGRMMSHQSLFTKIDIMRQYQFDERFKICADYDFVVRVKKNRCSMQYVDRIVSIVDNMGGISSQIGNYKTMRNEDDRSLKENFPLWYYLLVGPKAMVRFVKEINENKAENRIEEK